MRNRRGLKLKPISYTPYDYRARKARMEAYDRLPKELREFLKTTSLNWSPVIVEEDYKIWGIKGAIERIKEKEAQAKEIFDSKYSK